VSYIKQDRDRNFYSVSFGFIDEYMLDISQFNSSVCFLLVLGCKFRLE
jgi:hypothetical protein